MESKRILKRVVLVAGRKLVDLPPDFAENVEYVWVISTGDGVKIIKAEVR